MFRNQLYGAIYLLPKALITQLENVPANVKTLDVSL